jgi:hypothetical protein
MQVDVKGMLCKMVKVKVRDLGTGIFLLVLPSEQPKNAISRAALVSIAVSMFDSKDKEKSSLQSPRRFKGNTSRLSKIHKNPSTLNHLQSSTIFHLSCDLPLVAGKAP